MGDASGETQLPGRSLSWPWRCWRRPWNWAIWRLGGLPEMTPSGRRSHINRTHWRPWVCGTCWTFRAMNHQEWPLEPMKDESEIARQFTSRVRAPPQTPRLRDGQRRTHVLSAVMSCRRQPWDAGSRSTAAEGSQGRRTYRFSAHRVRVTQEAQACSEIRRSGRTAGTWTAANLAG